MTYGRVSRHLAVVFIALFLPLSLAAAPIVTKSAPLPVTLLSVSAGSLQVQGSDGRALSFRILPASLFLRRGLLVSAREFTPGDLVILRKRAGVGGSAQVTLLCDLDSAAAIENYRRRPLTGQILSADAAAWVIQPQDSPNSVPLTLRMSSATTYQANGAAASAAAFGPGTAVTITTRGLTDGLLLAVSVTEAADRGAAAPTTGEPRRAAFVSGSVLTVQPETNTVTIQDKNGANHTVATDGRTRIKVRRLPAALADIRPGMRVSVWLGKNQDSVGNSIATTISASDATPGKK